MQKKTLVTVISFHRGSAGEPGRGLVYQGLRVMDKTSVSLRRDSVGEPGEEVRLPGTLRIN